MPADHFGNKGKVLGPHALERGAPFGRLFPDRQYPVFLARIVMASRQIVDECRRHQLRQDVGPVSMANDPGVNRHAGHMARAVDQARADKVSGSWLEYLWPRAGKRIIRLHRPMFAGFSDGGHRRPAQYVPGIMTAPPSRVPLFPEGDRSAVPSLKFQ